MQTYCTEYRRPDGRLFEGPRIKARSWREAQRMADLFGGTVVGIFVADIPWGE